MVLGTLPLYLKEGVLGLFYWIILLAISGELLFIYIFKFKCNHKEKTELSKYSYLQIIISSTTLTWVILLNSIKGLFEKE